MFRKMSVVFARRRENVQCQGRAIAYNFDVMEGVWRNAENASGWRHMPLSIYSKTTSPLRM